jgi:hypothetical protein
LPRGAHNVRAERPRKFSRPATGTVLYRRPGGGYRDHRVLAASKGRRAGILTPRWGWNDRLVGDTAVVGSCGIARSS